MFLEKLKEKWFKKKKASWAIVYNVCSKKDCVFYDGWISGYSFQSNRPITLWPHGFTNCISCSMFNRSNNYTRLSDIDRG